MKIFYDGANSIDIDEPPVIRIEEGKVKNNNCSTPLPDSVIITFHTLKDYYEPCQKKPLTKD